MELLREWQVDDLRLKLWTNGPEGFPAWSTFANVFDRYHHHDHVKPRDTSEVSMRTSQYCTAHCPTILDVRYTYIISTKHRHVTGIDPCSTAKRLG